MVYKPNDNKKSKKQDHSNNSSTASTGSAIDPSSSSSGMLVGSAPSPTLSSANSANSVVSQLSSMHGVDPLMDAGLRHAVAPNPIGSGAPLQASQQQQQSGLGGPNPTSHSVPRAMKGVRHPGSKAATPEPMPLREAAMMEMKSLPSKTPVSVLQELLSRRGTTPKYELVQVEGAIHEPTFRYRVSVAPDVVATGTGRSKKEAKHTAAKAVLDRLIAGNGGGGGVGVGGEGGNGDIGGSEVGSISGRKIGGGVGGGMSPYCDQKGALMGGGGNPIGLLQELCMSRRWPPPGYDTEHEEGLPHERQFTIACNVYKYKEIGTGKSKKLAKRQAANKMWYKLKDMPVENNLQFSFDDDEEMTQRVTNKFSDLKEAKISTLNPQTSLKVSQFHKNLKSSYGIKLNELQTAILKVQTFNYVQFLQEIASEQQFEVTYVDIEEKTITGKCQCLVQLSTLPVAVCHGQGATSKEAQTEAALNALEYLKIMTKK